MHRDDVILICSSRTWDFHPIFFSPLVYDSLVFSDHIPPSEVVSSSLSLHRGLVRISEGRVQLALEQGLFYPGCFYFSMSIFFLFFFLIVLILAQS